MGFFKRTDPADQAQPSRRAAASSEVQAAALRGRARRRLVGAIALVLAAVIILPMVLDSQTEPVVDDIPIRVPERNTPFQPQVSEPQATAPQGVALDEPPVMPTPSVASAPPHTPSAIPPRPEPKSPESKSEPKPAVSKPEVRSDDGARALALLEGRAAPTHKPQAAKGNFVLQIAAYTTSEDAQSRRDKLHQAGVTNAFVEQATVGGKRQYRLRVGPFPSREAAQAAQARLRTLGYDNGFIAAAQ